MASSGRKLGPSSQPPVGAANQAPTLDPRFIAMASRISAYYQQRCQAVARFQQQRCQAWANMHRQKCQEMMQAAMLVVAWYIRDRIQRRRRRQRRRFRRALSAKNRSSSRARVGGEGRVGKGEAVRRWVLGVPRDALSPSDPARDKFADREEAEFSLDREPEPDRDAKLFSVADNLIKSQLSRIDVPLMGTLSFDESDSETESETESISCCSEDDEGRRYDDEVMDGYEDGIEEGQEEGAYDDELEDDDDDDDDEEEDEEKGGKEDDLEGAGINSQEVHVGTGKRSRDFSQTSSSLT
ncbi:hypothetical protein VTK73DRAFT_6180 [Phialemonium thermophilum]|uniref:Uncharacterized protein n=1 Tax=Phialemonium thermophilum TaxID=223376 RepID=A0ABR3UZX2_9PEZI